MASVSSTSSTSSILTSLSNSRISGLASGLDTDGLVESMTAGTRAKIAKIEQQKQKAAWKMEAYRSISSKLIAFQNKFTSYTSATNLRSTAFYSKNLISAVGEYSKYVKASGNGENLGSATIAGVKQLATQTSYISSNTVSKSTLESSEAIDVSQETEISNLAGQSITLKYNNNSYTLTLDSSKDYKTMEDVAEELKLQLSKTDYATDDKKLNEIIKFSFEGGKLSIDYASDAVEEIGNTIEVTSVGSKFGSIFGIEKGMKTTAGENGETITGKKAVTDADIAKEVTKHELKDILAEKEFTFTYNGKSTTIKLGKTEEIDAYLAENSEKTIMDYVKEKLQEGMDSAFGSGRVEVSWKNGKLGFKTTLPNGSNDTTSVLTLSSGNTNALKALNLKSGASNRLNMEAGIADSGFKFHRDNGLNGLTKEDYVIRIVDKITGKEYKIDKTVDGTEFSANTSMKDIIEAINASDAKVKVSYLSTSDKLSITSTQEGASGDFAIVGTGATFNASGGLTSLGDDNLGTALFGRGIKGLNDSMNGMVSGKSNYNVTDGQDAIIYVDYDGKGGADPVEMTRSSNTFDLNGVSVTVSGTFMQMREKVNDKGEVVMENGKPVMELDPEAAVSFEAKADVDKITEAVKEMITAYNEIVELSNKLVSEKPNRDYAPLTDEQKEEMSEDEIKKWNEKAQAGMLFNDLQLRGFTNDIRFLFGSDAETIKALEGMGITSATSYNSSGKINFDENAFKNAVETNLDSVKNIFTAVEESYKDDKGNKVIKKQGGIMNNIKTIFDKYGSVEGATKGIFVQEAGATESPLSMLNNFIQNQMDEFDDLIATLKDKMADEAERYYKQFSNLEVYINNMNQQSSWLYSQTSGSY